MLPDSNEVEANESVINENKKSKKKKSKPLQAPSCHRIWHLTASYVAVGQTDRPTIPIEQLFPNGHYPRGRFKTILETLTHFAPRAKKRAH